MNNGYLLLLLLECTPKTFYFCRCNAQKSCGKYWKVDKYQFKKVDNL